MNFQHRTQQIEALVRKIESLSDPDDRASMLELLKLVMDLNGGGLERVMTILFEAGESGRAIMDRFADDNLIAGLLLLYGLHPLDFETRVKKALDKVRPYLQSHGCDVELLGVENGVVRLRLDRSRGCASSEQMLNLAIEDAMYEAAPDLTRLEVEGVVEPATRNRLVQLERPSAMKDPRRKGGNGNWTDVTALDSFEQ